MVTCRYRYLIRKRCGQRQEHRHGNLLHYTNCFLKRKQAFTKGKWRIFGFYNKASKNNCNIVGVTAWVHCSEMRVKTTTRFPLFTNLLQKLLCYTSFSRISKMLKNKHQKIKPKLLKREQATVLPSDKTSSTRLDFAFFSICSKT